jgi:hypothetical protein
MSDIFKPQRKCIPVLLTTVMLMRGRVNFRNSSRYSELSGKTFSRQFRTPSDFTQFNGIGIGMSIRPDTSVIAAPDCSFIPKSGRHTYGPATFYNGTRSEAEKGLEISEPAVADVTCDTAYSLSVWQTPAGFAGQDTRPDRYPEHFLQDAQCLPPSVRYPAADAYYARKRFTDGVSDAGYFMISKFRHDADLRCLYTGKQKSRGRHRICDGTVCSDNLSRSGSVSETDNPSLYTAVVSSPCFRRSVRIVCIVRRLNDKIATALLFPTDIHLSATDIYRFYKARFRPGCSVPGCGAVCRTSGLSVPLRNQP